MAGTTNALNNSATSFTVDNLNLDGNTIISTDTNGDINLSPDGTGTVVVNTDLDVDNLNLNGNTISSTDTNGDINITPDGTGSVIIPAATTNAILLGGASNAISATSALTNGQLAVGATSAAPNLLTMSLEQGNNCLFWNLSYTISAGTLTIAGYDGTALSSTNPAYVYMPSNVTAGRGVLYTLTGNSTLTVSDMTGATFGTTGSAAWGDTMPLFIGFIADSSDTNGVFGVARIPNIKAAPSSGGVADPAAPTTASTERSFFAFSNITEANYASSCVGLIGAVGATKDASDAWTIAAIDGVNTGAGKWSEQIRFDFPPLQNGANDGFLLNNSGTAPSFGSNAFSYNIDRSGRVFFTILLSGDGGTDGSGAVSTQMALPYQMTPFEFGSDLKSIGVAWIQSAGGGHDPVLMLGEHTSNPSITEFKNMLDGVVTINSLFSNGSRNIWGCGNYAILQS